MSHKVLKALVRLQFGDCSGLQGNFKILLIKEVEQAPKSHLSPEFQPLPVCDAYNVVNLFCSLKLSGEHFNVLSDNFNGKCNDLYI